MAEFELGSDEWFADHLLKQLSADYPRLSKCRQYLRGENQLPGWGTGRSLAEYSDIVQISKLNFANQIVSAHVSRKELVGVDTALSTAEGDADADVLFDDVGLDLQYAEAALSKATYGRGYLTAFETEDAVQVVATNAWRTISMPDETRPWLSKAAVTISWNAETASDYVTLYRAGEGDKPAYRVRWARVQESGESGFPSEASGEQFDIDLSAPEWSRESVITSRGGSVCPVLALTTEDGLGEFEKHYATLDRINHTILQRLVITVMQAFKQRALAGKLPSHYPEGHPRAGEPVNYDELFKAGPDAIWILPEDAKMWESDAIDISPILEAVKDDLKHLASASSTPLYVLSPEAASGSAEGASLSRETHFLKTRRDRNRDKKPIGWVVRILFLASGDSARAEGVIEPVWGNTAIVSPYDQANTFKLLRDGKASLQFALRTAYGLSAREVRQELRAANRESLAAS